MTGHASVDSAVEAMKLGAYDYLQKPIDSVRLEVLVKQALEDRRLIDEVAALRAGSPEAVMPTITCWARARGCARSSTGVARVASSHVHGPDHGRDGDGQGAGRPGDPFQRRDTRRGRWSP